jgi:hypothetical protein
MNEMTTLQYQDQQPQQQMSYEDQLVMPFSQGEQQMQQLGNKNDFYYSFQESPTQQQRQPNRMRLANYLPQFVTKRFQKQQQISPAFGMAMSGSQQVVQYPNFNSAQMEQHQTAVMAQQQYGYDSSEQVQQQQPLQHYEDAITDGQQVYSPGAAIPQLQRAVGGKVVDHQLLGRAMAKHHTYLRNEKVKGDVRYFFYDPRSTVRRRDGSLYLPSVVYDTNGKPVSIHSLSSSTSNTNQIYMEPPRGSSMGYLYSNYSLSNSTNTTLSNATLAPTYDNTTNTTSSFMDNYTWVHPNVVHTPVRDGKKGMVAISDMRILDWGQSTSYDSSIIVCTVGLMALLVGAISARRMRSRSILSMCIENESLEDDIAYDTAYTISAGDANQYHTFNNQGWKGDLEKFDV